MAMKVGINGFGRIGRLVFRDTDEAEERVRGGAHQRYHRRQDAGASPEVRLHARQVQGHGQRRRQHHRRRRQEDRDFRGKGSRQASVGQARASTSWSSPRACSARRSRLQKHINAGAKKVLLTVPAKDEIDATIVMGVNNRMLKASDKIISNASCTTNCLSPHGEGPQRRIRHRERLHDDIHAYTNDQRILDLPHKDLGAPARPRSTSSRRRPAPQGHRQGHPGAEAGKLDGISLRVPVSTGR